MLRYPTYASSRLHSAKRIQLTRSPLLTSRHGSFPNVSSSLSSSVSFLDFHQTSAASRRCLSYPAKDSSPEYDQDHQVAPSSPSSSAPKQPRSGSSWRSALHQGQPRTTPTLAATSTAASRGAKIPVKEQLSMILSQDQWSEIPQPSPHPTGPRPSSNQGFHQRNNNQQQRNPQPAVGNHQSPQYKRPTQQNHHSPIQPFPPNHGYQQQPQTQTTAQPSPAPFTHRNPNNSNNNRTKATAAPPQQRKAPETAIQTMTNKPHPSSVTPNLNPPTSPYPSVGHMYQQFLNTKGAASTAQNVKPTSSTSRFPSRTSGSVSGSGKQSAQNFDLIESIRSKLAAKSQTTSGLFGKKTSETSTTKTESSATSLTSSTKQDEDEKPKSFLREYIENLKKRKKEKEAAEAGSSSLLEKIPLLSTNSRFSSPLPKEKVSDPDAELAEMARFEAKVYQEEHQKNHLKSGKTDKHNLNKVVKLPDFEISVVDTANLLSVNKQKIRFILRSIGELPRSKQFLKDQDFMIQPEVLQLVAIELGIDAEVLETEEKSDKDLLLERRAANVELLPPRPPVVCIMGHVDHGKTTLMDTLRRMAKGKSNKKQKRKEKKAKTAGSSDDSDSVAGTEAGGITQVISAFQVPLPGHEMGAVTFLDTPGHAAFKSMRQSGSDAADIIVLVVAADDGVSPQTVEIINFYKSIVEASGGDGISMVVAMNKIDKPGVIEDEARMRIENELQLHNIYVEGMSGSSEGSVGSPVQLFPISGLTGEGVEDLIDGLALQSEVMDLRADEAATAEGFVMDAKVEQGLGIVVDCVIRWGTIQKGDFVVSGDSSGKVRILKDVDGKTIKKATPSQPVRLTGLDSLPKAGDPIVCVAEEEFREQVKRRAFDAENAALEQAENTAGNATELQCSSNILRNYESVDEFRARWGFGDDVRKDGPIRIPVIIRADADGTLSAIRDSIVGMGEESNFDVVIDPIISKVGPLLENEIETAKQSNAAIFCFNVKTPASLERRAKEKDVTLLTNDVIYRLIEGARESFGKYLPKVRGETVHGRAEVGLIFDIDGISTKVAGLKVNDGALYKEKTPASEGRSKCYYRVKREGEIVSRDEDIVSTSLKHFKEDVTMVESGKECGLALDGHNDFQVGDEIECYSIDWRHQTFQ